jgi:putative PIN family toxin of toxin-antitoxin system
MIGLVIDTNVLVSANLNADGLEAVVVALAFNGRIQMHVSSPIFAEYERVLLYPRLKFG